jgi:Flp pilus assembly protein CpaB
MTYRIRNLVIAIGLALVALLLTLFYVTNYKRTIQQGASNARVWVAAHDVAAGVSGADLLKQNALHATDVPKRSVVPGAISTPEQVRTLVLSAPLYAGEQVTLRRFTDVAAEGVRAQLKGTMRAVQISGSPDQMLYGTLHPGDHVDVVANLRLDSTKAAAATRIVLRDLTVLGEPDQSTASRVTQAGSSSALLAVTDTQVQRLFFVLKNADWTLELRPVVDATDSSERVDTLDTVLRQGVR